MSRKKLGELLTDRRHILPADLERAMEEQSRRNTLLGEILLEHGKVTKADLISALEEVTRTKYFDCIHALPQPEALVLLPRAIAERYCVLPLRIERRTLHLAMAEPQNLVALDELRFLAGMRLEPCIGFRQEILAAIDNAYGVRLTEEAWVAELSEDERIEFISTSTSESNKVAMREFQAELRGAHTPAVRIVSSIVRVALAKKASDIHVEQGANDATVRIRIDGVLRELMRVPAELRMQLVSRIKILADMDIAERRVSQDGRFLATVGERQIDLRVSTLPTQYGEKVVMRLLDSAAATVPFERLGFSHANAEQLYKVLAMPQGMVLVTGPTGSGKSTTLYSGLNFLKSPRVNITTIEDPVEYVVEGVNQVQINPKAGRTFASCLRSMLRQDPNVLMVGEIRDGETAEIALTAAQTGHLVLSTLHTNDAVSAITRLVDLNVPSFLVASSVTAVIAQRLVRKLCPCRNEVPVSRDYSFRMRGMGLEPGEKMYLPVGCGSCERTGYKGRIGIYEVLLLNEQIRAAIRAESKDDELRTMARVAGMESMRDDAMLKVNTGVTTLDEVLRVVPVERDESPSCRECEQLLSTKFKFCPQCGVKLGDLLLPAAVAMPAQVQ